MVIDEKIFVCPDQQFVKLTNGTLSLHTENSINSYWKISSFPHKRIHQGDCLMVNQHYVFFGTLVDGRMLLPNFTSSLYRELEVSEHAIYFPQLD